MPQATYVGDFIGGSTVRGLLGAFCYKEVIMEKPSKFIESVRWEEDFDVERLRCWGVKPLLIISEIMSDETSFEDINEHWSLCNLLRDMIIELDNTLQRVIDEKYAAILPKIQAA